MAPPEGPATARVVAAYARLAEVDRPEVWIALRPQDEVLREAAQVDARLASGEDLPLAGTVLAVKDNIDVAGMPTTAGCPGYAYEPVLSAPAVARLVAAGALVLGKTNLDQFATGLVGTRSPYGAVRHAWLEGRVSGGSSSGSAVAVSLGVADLGVATDTAGSGRVPAALHGLIGLKPTPGVVPTLGVVPAMPSFDCVSVLARSLDEAELAVALMSGPHPDDPRCLPWPADAPLGEVATPRVAVPRPAQLAELGHEAADAFAAVLVRLARAGATTVEVDISAFLEAAALLYGGALVAERYASVGAFLDTAGEGLDPSVASVVGAARDLPAHRYVQDRVHVAELRRRAMAVLAGTDALLLPTVAEHPTAQEVAADPLGTNTRLGRFTNFANLFAMAAVAVPAGTVQDRPFGVTVLAPSHRDHVAVGVARRLLSEPPSTGPLGLATGVPLLVVGAHLRGLPLHDQLGARGGRFLREVRTSPDYRLLALPTDPPKPGLQHVGPSAGGISVPGELYLLPAAGLAGLLADLPAPMVLGSVALDDGSTVTGFLCHLPPTTSCQDISAWGGWRAYLGVG